MKRLSMLLVDDDRFARNILKEVLMGLECPAIHAVSSGDEAIKVCKGSHFDIVFLDIEMPGINGFETLEKILEDTPDQYVVMVSGHSTLDNIQKAMKLGVKGFIVKPYSAQKVLDLLAKYRKDCSPLPKSLSENPGNAKTNESAG